MPNIFFAVFLALFYSIVYTVAGPVIAAQDIQFDRPPLFSFILCFIVCTAVNIFLFSVMPRLHSAAGNGRLSRYLDRHFDKVGERRLFCSSGLSFLCHGYPHGSSYIQAFYLTI